MAVDVLNPNLGISTVLPQAGAEHLPSVENFNTVGRVNSGAAAESFKSSISANAFDEKVSAAFTPVLSSDELLQPAKLNASIHSAFEKLSQMQDDADVRRFLRDDLKPFMENRGLLEAYINLMVEG